MCTSFYLGALRAAVLMGRALEDAVPLYEELLERGVSRMEGELFDGEYFIQKVQWRDLRATNPETLRGVHSDEVTALLKKEGPMYQYGRCLLYTSPSPRDRTRSRMPSSA